MSLPYVNPELQMPEGILRPDDGRSHFIKDHPHAAKEKRPLTDHARGVSSPVGNGVLRSVDRSGTVIKIKDRSSTITPQLVGYSFAVYNGKEYKTFGKITPDHVGRKFGEFSPTKKPAIYKKKK